MKTTLAASAILGSLLLTPACAKTGSSGSAEGLAPEYDSFQSIPMVPLTGQLGGEPFRLQDARFKVDRRPGRERVEILLSSAAAPEPCGAIPEGAAAVSLSFAGRTELEPAELRHDPAQPAGVIVRAQWQEKRHWLGNSTASALIAIRTFDPALRLEGDISVCFADPSRSCVSGTFAADPCHDVLDEGPRAFPLTSKLEVERVRSQLSDAGAAEAAADGGGADAAP